MGSSLVQRGVEGAGELLLIAELVEPQGPGGLGAANGPHLARVRVTSLAAAPCPWGDGSRGSWGARPPPWRTQDPGTPPGPGGIGVLGGDRVELLEVARG